jgi:hypothetical protein
MQERSLSLLAPYLFAGGEPAASVLRRLAAGHLGGLLETGGPAVPGLCILETRESKEGT